MLAFKKEKCFVKFFKFFNDLFGPLRFFYNPSPFCFRKGRPRIFIRE